MLVFTLVKDSSKKKRFFCDLKIFWDEIRSIFGNVNWRLLLASFGLINGCMEAFQVEAVFMMRNVLTGSPDEIHLQVNLVLCAFWISKFISSLIAGLIADRFHNFKKLGLGMDFMGTLCLIHTRIPEKEIYSMKSLLSKFPAWSYFNGNNSLLGVY